MKKSTWIILILVLFLALFIKTYNLGYRYTFDWDQQDDALKTMSMVWERKPVLIGPRVANDNGFFVGPYHYYFLLPFYLATGGHPIAGACWLIIVSLLTVVTYFYVGWKLYGEKVGLVAAFIASLATGVTSFNAMYIPMISLSAYYLCIKQLESGHQIYKLALLSGLAATIHLVPASIVPLVILVFLMSKNRPGKKEIFLSLLTFVAFFIPTVIFELRHDFLITHKLTEFIFNSSGNATVQNRLLFLRSFWRSVIITGSLKITPFAFVENLLGLASLAYGILSVKKTGPRIFTLIWVIFPLTFLAFYHGNIPEYYYGVMTALLPLFLSVLIVQIFPVFLAIILLGCFFFIQLKIAITTGEYITLQNKLAVVKYIVTQKQDPIFNVSYYLPMGMDNGYQYLFKYLGREPVNRDEGHLYTITTFVNEGENVVFQSGPLNVIRR